MNIFYTSNDPITCANEHCSVHTRKMIVEYAQLLSTAHHVLDGDKAIKGIYKCTHKNHPSAVWVRESTEHYNYVYFVMERLIENYAAYTGKTHATSKLLRTLWDAPLELTYTGFREPPKCMPDEFKEEDTCISYKKYLKHKYQEWQSREKPIKVRWYFSKPEWVKQ